MLKSPKIIKNQKRNAQGQDGLTMVELLVTISIIVLVSTVILVLGDKALGRTGFFSMHTKAVFFAKEGAEILTDTDIRNMIRSDISGDGSWSGVGFWNVDYKGNVDKRSSESDCHRKLRVNSEGFYAIGAPADQETSFSRCIIVSAVDSTDNLDVKIETAFEYDDHEYKVSLYRIFYD